MSRDAELRKVTEAHMWYKLMQWRDGFVSQAPRRITKINHSLDAFWANWSGEAEWTDEVWYDEWLPAALDVAASDRRAIFESNNS